MTQQIINIGSAPNDSTGDPIRTAFTKTNANFTELYAGVPQCGRLVLGSASPASTLKFIPYLGDQIKINGIVYLVPSAGITGASTSVYVEGVAGQNLASNTFYYVYLFNNAGTLTFDYSTTAHATSATAGNVGIEIKSGDDTRTLIGIVYTASASPLFYDSAAFRYMRSWFNRLRTVLSNAQSSWGPAGATSYTGTGVNSLAFIQFAGEALSVHALGYMINSAGASNVYNQLYLDGTIALGGEVMGTSPAAGYAMPMASTAVTDAASEGGVHSVQLLYKVVGGTGSGTAQLLGNLG